MGFEIKNGVLEKYTEEKGVTEVVIPDSVTSIGDSAFSECSKLKSITIPDSVTSIGGSAFYMCSSLTSITIPDSVTSIGDWAFENCWRLTSVTIPDSVTNIGEGAFAFCSLTSITVPATVSYYHSWFPNDQAFLLNNTPIFLSIDEDDKFEVELTSKVISGETITAEFLQKARRRETKDPIYLNLCRKGQEDCLAYVKKSIMRFAKDAIDRNCIAELKEFESYGFITKSNAGKLAEYALEKEKQNNEVILYLLEIKDKNGKFKLEELDRMIEKAQGNVEITAWLLECKNKHFTVDEIDKIETEKMEKEIGVKERTAADWKKIFSFEVSDNEVMITGYKGDEPDIFVPEKICGKPVTAIGDFAFSPNKPRTNKNVKETLKNKIRSINIGENIIRCGKEIFMGCKSLETITIGGAVINIHQSIGKFDGKPIDWSVVDISLQDRTAFLLCDYIVTNRYYDEDWNGIWSECGLRKWLNNEFISDCFNENEKKIIAETEHIDESVCYDSADEKYMDKVFILSKSEFEMISANDAMNIIGKKYWLRTEYIDYVLTVKSDGKIDWNSDDDFNKNRPTKYGVLPAMNIKATPHNATNKFL